MSIFNNKALKGVTEAVAKIMEAEKMAKKDHDQDGKIETGKAEYLGSRIRAARLAGKLKEEDDLHEGEQGDLRRVANRMMNITGKKHNINTQTAGWKSKIKNDAANMPVDSRKDAISGLRKISKKLKEEEQLDELSKSTVKSYVMKKMEKPTTDKKDVKGLTNAYNRLKNYKPTSEAVELEEERGDVRVRNKTSGKELMIPAIAVKTYEKHGYFPVPGSVKEGFDDMDKYMKDKNKESSFEKKKTDKGTAYSRKPEKTEKKVEEGFDDMDKYMKDKNKPQPSGSAGKKPGKAYGGSKQADEKKSMTEMLELYNEHGLKILSMINTKSVNFGETEVEVIDADDVNGFVETVVEEVDNETFTKEVNAQKAKAEGKGKKAEVAKASVQAVKQEEVELGEARKLEGSYKNAGGHESKVYKLSGEHNEGDPYHVKLFKGGKHHEPADYFTDDKDDAHSTAKRMVKESLDERHLTAAETKEKEMNVKGMKKNLSGFKARYGDRAKEVMYATATKQAKKD